MAQYLRLHLDQHVACLSQFFDVTMISGDCDYGEICDTYQPDLALFESGVYVSGVERKISNINSNPQVLKLGFCHADAMCGSRRTFISDMADWGVDTFFTLSVSMAEYTPEIADRLYFWPNAVDTELYRDYGEQKIIPVLLAGSQAPMYPWRNRVFRRVTQKYPSLTCPHFGWGTESATSRTTYGEPYARLLNASLCAPTCGGVTNDVVRKHLEIPASKTCLVTQESAALTSAGFVNGENCIFADAENVVEALDHLFGNMSELERITAAGFDLVRSRHTIKQRNQIFQWLNLKKGLRANERIVQKGPFDSLTVVEREPRLSPTYVVSNGLDRQLLRDGDKKLESKDLEAAQRLFLRALSYLPLLPEAKLRVAMCCLLSGDPSQANNWISELTKSSAALRSSAPDPMEWTFHIITLLCQGKTSEAANCAAQYHEVRHPELDRIRLWISEIFASPCSTVGDAPVKRRTSVHELPAFMSRDWADAVCSMLKACKQTSVAKRLADCAKLPKPAFEAPQLALPVRSELPRREPLPRHVPTIRRRLPAAADVAVQLRVRLKSLLHDFERRYGYVLPYRISAMRSDELCQCIEGVAREEDMQTILIIGATAGEGATEACLLGAQSNPTRPSVVCINESLVELGALKKRNSNLPLIEYHRTVGELPGPEGFGMVLVTGNEQTSSGEQHEAPYSAGIVVIKDMAQIDKYRIVERLSQNEQYSVVAYNAEHPEGYAVFKRNF